MEIGVANGVQHIWEWPVALHFVLSALVGGLIGIAGFGRLINRDQAARVATYIAFPLLVVDLLVLWLDLTRGLLAFWLFLSFRVTAAISWGSWALFLTSLVNLIYLAEYLGYIELPHTADNAINWSAMGLAIAVTTYTGAMLTSSMAAMPLASSMLLAPLFSVSAIAMAGGLLELVNVERTISAWALTIASVSSAILFGFYVGELYGGNLAVQEAYAHLVGNYGLIWWLTIGIGFGLPAVLAVFWMTSQTQREKLICCVTKAVALFSLFGGVGIRFVLLMAGQGH
ncbi:MAG: NrfD/PsrC family molybdoenzyme membrane anchor subunit [Candidatus Bipolaricaulota bacterium]|nr:polysulfide reductase NrfD [Candidatus Bipolaricaulota bacterium]